MAEFLRNALFGIAVGDALGVPHEKNQEGPSSVWVGITHRNRIEKECGRTTLL